MSRIPRIPSLVLIGLIATAAPGCGEDAPAPGGDQKAAKDLEKKAAADKKKADAAAKKKKTGKKVEVVSFIRTLEKTVPAEESKTIRRKLKDRDFASDPTGADNRDPFRSYLLPTQGSLGPDASGGAATAKPTEECAKDKLVATDYALRDLALIGIIKRGAVRYAQFRDAKGVGHIVARGSCLGREKAKVDTVGESHVTILVQPEAQPNVADPPAEKKSIALFEHEITAENLDEVEETAAPPPAEAGGTTTPAAPPSAPALPPPSMPPPSP